MNIEPSCVYAGMRGQKLLWINDGFGCNEID